MDIESIINAVRLCYDEEQLDSSDFGDVSDNDNTLMDNIIKSKIGDALRWVCIYGPADLLGGKDNNTDVGILVDKDNQTPAAITNHNGGSLDLPSDYIKLVRVRVQGWHRAVMNPISEDSDEYLQLYDENGANATNDRPQAALIERSAKKLEVWPTGTASYTYVSDPTIGQEYDENNPPLIPPKAKTAFIYYLAFLVLSAYEDSRAARMLEIAKMNIGRNG